MEVTPVNGGEKALPVTSKQAVHCCNLIRAPGSSDKIKAALSLRLRSDDEKDILKEGLGENYKRVKKAALDILAKSNGKHMTTNAKEVMCDTLLPFKMLPDEWKIAEPLTKINKLQYPFGIARPNSQELAAVYKAALTVTMNAEGSTDIDVYIAHMFGKSKKEHQSAKETMIAEANAPQLSNVQLKLMQGRNLLARDINGTSNPYCVIGLITKEHQHMVASARHSLVDLNRLKKLDLESEQSRVARNTVNPNWNQEFELPINNSTSDLLVIEVWDKCCGISAKLKDFKLSKYGWAVNDNGEGDDYMGRAFLPLSMISSEMTNLTLPLYSRNQKRQYGEVRVGAKIFSGKPQLKEQKMLPEHTKLAAAVLDFESHMSGKYKIGWDGRISPLGHKLLYQHAALNGITTLQQVSVLFSLAQKYENKVKLSIMAYGGLVKAVSTHQQELPPYGDSLPDWAVTIYSSLTDLERLLFGMLSRHHEYARFSTQRGIDFLIAHLRLLKELYNIAPYTKQKIDATRDLTINVKSACRNACSHLFVKDTRPSSTDEVKRVSCFLAVVEYMIEQLMNCTGQVNEWFQSVGVDYFTLFYLVIDKELSSAAQLYTINYMNKGSVAAYHLYLKIRELLSLSSRIPESLRSTLDLLKYKKWFESFIGEWVNTACTLFYNEVKKSSTETRKAWTITGDIQISHSACNVTIYIQQLAKFWDNLDSKNWTEHGDHLIRIIETVTHSASSYAGAAWEMLKSSGNSDETRFVANELFCITLNDIEHMRVELSRIPELLSFTSVDQSTSTLLSVHTMLINASEEIKHYSSLIVSYVGKQLSNDIGPMLKEVLKSGTKALEPLTKYFITKLSDLQPKLLVAVLESILMEMWSFIVSWSLENADNLTMGTARHLKGSFKELEAFFYCNSEGLPLDVLHTEEYNAVLEKVNMIGSTNEELILLHLKTLADWSQADDKPNGELTCTVAYVQSKGYLEVNVIKGTNLPVMDIGGASDPYVEVVLMPENKIRIKAVKTKTIKANVNPYYGKEFTIKIKPSLFSTSGAVLTFSVYDVNTLKSDEFMGMAAIQCKDIPQLKTPTSDLQDASSPKRMNAILTLVRDTRTPALRELKNRKDHYVDTFNSRHKK